MDHSAFFGKSPFAIRTTTEGFRPDTLPLLTMKLQIQLGNPKSDCRNYGICRVQRLESEHLMPEGRERSRRGTAFAICRLHEDSILEIRFSKSSMNQQTTRQHFGKGVFTLEEDFIFPLGLLKEVHLKYLVLRQKAYPVIEQEGNLSVFIPCFYSR
jgi:hypothetical protein